MIHRVVIVAAVVTLSFLLVCNAGVIQQTAKDTIHKALSALEDVEERLEPSVFEVTATIGELFKNTTSKYSWQNIQDVFSECLQDCLALIYDEEAIKACIYEKKENCEAMKNYDDKDLIPYYTSLKAGSKMTHLPGKAIGAALGLGGIGDVEFNIGKRAVNAGVKLIETTAAEKLTEEFLESGKQKVSLLGFMNSFDKLSDDLENAFNKGKNALENMIDSGKNLSVTEEAHMLKTSLDEGNNLVKTALKTSKDIAKSVTALPIESTIETSNYAIDHLLDSGIKLVKSDEADQVKTAVEDGKNAIQNLFNSSRTLTESIKSIPREIASGITNCTTKMTSDSVSTAAEKVEQLKQDVTNGKSAFATLVNSTSKLSESLATLPMKTIMDVGNFYIDSVIESGLKIAKSDEAMLLNSVAAAGKSTTDSVVDNGKKFVETIIEIPRKTAEDMKAIAVETLSDSKVIKPDPAQLQNDST